jgi:hypothetical protein
MCSLPEERSCVLHRQPWPYTALAVADPAECHSEKRTGVPSARVLFEVSFIQKLCKGSLYVMIPLRSCVRHSMRCRARYPFRSSPTQLSRTSRVVIAATIKPTDLDRLASFLMPYKRLVNHSYEKGSGACLL